MRKLVALAFAITACSGKDRANIPAGRTASPSSARGPDALLLRVPKSGGVARVTGYPNIDSTVWTSSDAAPALDRVLAFDADAGLIAAQDSRGLPLWLDLHTGAVTIPGRGKLRNLTSVDGSTIYGVGADGAVARFTPTGNWVFKPPAPARAAFPQSNGTLLVFGGRDQDARVWQMRPPETKLTDTLAIPGIASGIGAPLGDRVYFLRPPRTIVTLRARTREVGRDIQLDHAVRAMASAPSGDRAYAIVDSANQLIVLDPYQNRVVSRAELPGRARDLRVDPFGRYVLVRAMTGDSVWVLSIGNDRVVETVRSTWRPDLPFVAVDGAIALADGKDVVFHGPRGDLRVDGGASDFWYPFVWNGLRPRAAVLDSAPPVPSDSDSANIVPPVAAETIATPPAQNPPVDTVKLGFTVSFAVYLDEPRARDEASKITVNGQTARVVTSMTNGTTVFRVVLGPYQTRDEADRAGRGSNHSFVIYSGTP